MENGKDWIDFNLVKQSVSMEMLIVHFAIDEISRKGDEVRLRCPFHTGKSGNSMAVNLIKNTFYCFGCKARGNVLDFVAKREQCTIKDAALKLGEWFGIEKESAEEADFSGEVSTTSTNASKLNESLSPELTIITNIESELTSLKKLLANR